jgi:CHAT domain-containing protein
LKSVASRLPSAEALQSELLVALLADGEADRDGAMHKLEQELKRRSIEPARLSDQSAIHLALGQRNANALEMVRALDWASKAVHMDPAFLPARFNEALALEKLSLLQRAHKAWGEYLAMETSPAWRREASARRAVLAAWIQVARWPRPVDLQEKTSGGGEADIRRLASLFPQAVREATAERLLPAWADYLQRGDEEGARRLLKTLLRVAQAHAELTGDQLLPDAVGAAIAASAPGNGLELGRAHGVFASGLEDLRRLDLEEADAKLAEAERGFRSANSPFALWADLSRGVCAYYDFDHAASERRFRRFLAGLDRRRYPGLAARALWLMGLTHSQRAQLGGALSAYLESLKVYEELGEAEHVAYLSFLVAETYQALGDVATAWRYRYRALQGLVEVHHPERAHNILYDAVLAALGENLPRAGLAFQGALAELAAEAGDPTARIEALRMEARCRRAVGEREAAIATLDKARRLLSELADHRLRQRLRVDVELDLARLLEESAPAEALRLTESFLAFSRETDFRFKLPEALAQEASTLLRVGRRVEAESTLTEAMAEFERGRSEIQDPRLRIAFFERSAEVFDRLTQLQAASGDERAAFDSAERSRGRGLLDALAPAGGPVAPAQPVTWSELGALLPPGVALLHLSLLPDSLMICLFVDGTSQCRFLGEAEAEQVRRLVSDLSRLVGVSTPDEARAVLSELYDLLLRPVAVAVPEGSHLVVVGDRFLGGLPFGALYDQASGRFLVERNPVSLAISASHYLRTVEASRDRTRRPRKRVLAAGGARLGEEAAARLPPLPRATEEIAAIARLYEEPVVLEGQGLGRQQFLRAVETADVVHYAGHAIANSERPDLSYLFVTPEADATTTHYVFAVELARLDLRRPQVVVLSACSSAQVSTGRLEGPAGLASAFLEGGVPAVVGTLWRVDDRLASELMQGFHARLATGLAASEALRRAQVDLIGDDARASHPLEWSAFVLFGDTPPATPSRLHSPDDGPLRGSA